LPIGLPVAERRLADIMNATIQRNLRDIFLFQMPQSPRIFLFIEVVVTQSCTAFTQSTTEEITNAVKHCVILLKSNYLCLLIIKEV
jgi:hypothetical protein